MIVNTTAVELGLGTGGWHVVHWSLDRTELSEPGPGHILKLRYTSAQVDTGSAEEHHPELAEADDLGGLPVVHVPLHSQMPAAVLGVRSVRPDARAFPAEQSCPLRPEACRTTSAPLSSRRRAFRSRSPPSPPPPWPACSRRKIGRAHV